MACLSPNNAGDEKPIVYAAWPALPAASRQPIFEARKLGCSPIAIKKSCAQISVSAGGLKIISPAAIYCGLGDHERALTYLEEAVASRNTAVPLRTLSQGFACLRSEPRFVELLKKMGTA